MAEETEAQVPVTEGSEAAEAPVAKTEAAEESAASEAPAEEKSADKAAPAVEEKSADKAAPAAEEKPADGAAPAAEGAAEPRRARGRYIPAGVAHIRATFNNTIVSVADLRGGVISWSSAGRAGFKGSRKSTAFAATVVAQEAARGAVAKGMHEVEVRMQGAGAGRESAVRGLQSSGLNISVIKDVTPIPHNGCRPRKRRRV
jgi:small subunit ribosomal protein S11